MNNSYFNRYFMYGDNIVKDRRNEKEYKFFTEWGARLFYSAFTKYEQDKLYYSGSIISSKLNDNVKFNDITHTNFILDFGSECYKLPLHKKANFIQRLFLRLMGFKKS